jgi:dihydroorotate dehydrogenase (NAD+) catalytic subunit
MSENRKMNGKNKASLKLEIGGVEFKNPVFSASGIWGYGDEIASIVDVSRLGAVVTKTITLEPRSGNPPPRIRELSTGLLNSIGLENVGLENFINEKLGFIKEKGVDVIVSLAADGEAEFDVMAERLSREEGYKGVEVNLSCPNVEKGHLDHGRDPNFVEKISGIIKRRFPQKPVFIKVTPNLTDIQEVARAAEAGGADAITAINTLLGADFDLETGKPVFAKVRAGYSGPGILPVALEKVWEIAGAVSIPVVGGGGIASVEDARKFFLAGAAAVQIGTQLFTDPELGERIVHALEQNPQRAGSKKRKE